jgi:hypothetical protein
MRGTRLLSLAAMLAALLFFGDAARAQEFAGDLVGSDASGKTMQAVGKIFVAKGTVRIETRELADGYFLIPRRQGAAYFVRPAQRVFMDAKQSSQLTQFFIPVDPDNPCRQWRVAAQIAGSKDGDGEWRCDRLGTESVDGRTGIKYRAVVSPDKTIHGWIDRELKIPLRMQSGEGAVNKIRNLKIGQQESAVFQMPDGYRKFDPQLLIERIKQSDVWVEPPAQSGVSQ